MKAINFFRIIAISLFIFSCNSFADNTSNTPMTDDMITQNVKNSIAADKSVSSLPITVATQQGIVSLSGQVHTDHEASRLIEIAESSDGVKDVDTTNLVVPKSKNPIEDTMITAKVKGVFIREKLFGPEKVPATSIHVETKNGTVYLTGHAKDQTQADNAVQLAKSVSGVKGVESKVVVKP